MTIEQELDLAISELEQLDTKLEAMERVGELACVISEEGYTTAIDKLFGDELRGYGIDTTGSKEDIVTILNQVSCSNEAVLRSCTYSLILATILGPQIGSIIGTLLDNMITNRELIAQLDKPSIELPKAFIEKINGVLKIQNMMSRKTHEKYFDAAYSVLKDLESFLSSGKLNENKIKSDAKKLDIELYGKKIVKPKKLTTIAKMKTHGWANADAIRKLHGNVRKSISVLKTIRLKTKTAKKRIKSDGELSADDYKLYKENLKQSIKIIRYSWYAYFNLMRRNPSLIRVNK